MPGVRESQVANKKRGVTSNDQKRVEKEASAKNHPAVSIFGALTDPSSSEASANVTSTVIRKAQF